jgi:hypothetical protein
MHLGLHLLCQSVPDAECVAVITMVRAASPEVKVLVLEAGHSSCSLHSDAAMESMDGPPALLQEIHALLGIAPSGQSSGIRRKFNRTVYLLLEGRQPVWSEGRRRAVLGCPP